MSEKVKVTERIYVDTPIEGTKNTYRVLAHLPGEEITAARAAEVGVTKGGKMSKTKSTAEAKSDDEATKDDVKAADEASKAQSDTGDVQTAEVRQGKPGTAKK